MAKKSTFKNMLMSMFGITALAGLAMATVYSMTKESIEKARKEKIDKAIRQVIADFDVIADTLILPADGLDSITIHHLYKGDLPAGTAVETYTDKGYSGRINLMVGFQPDGVICGIEVLEHRETAGLGTKMALPAFKNQFTGLNMAKLSGQEIKLNKDGGTIDAITAATVSSRAFCDAVQRACTINHKRRDR